jgi:hypothetical protein
MQGLPKLTAYEKVQPRGPNIKKNYFPERFIIF